MAESDAVDEGEALMDAVAVGDEDARTLPDALELAVGDADAVGETDGVSEMLAELEPVISGTPSVWVLIDGLPRPLPWQ